MAEVQTPSQHQQHEETTYCAVHPDRETSLRCNQCDRLMCTQCAVQTPVGYRCRQCVRQHDDKFFTGTTTDYLIVFAVSAVLSALGWLGITFLIGGFLIFVLLLSVPIGGVIGEAALRLTGRRRGRYSGYVGAAGAVAGPLAAMLLILGGLIPSLMTLIYVGVVAVTVFGRFKVSI
jgi:hypothetical protein